MDGFTLTWAGECSAWECDDLGHLNMRHYMTKASQARQMLILQLGLHDAFKPDCVSSVRVKNFHIKYLGEARPGDPLIIESAVLSLGEDSAQLCHMMYHTGRRLAATIVETIEHVYLRTRNPFAWPQRVRDAAAKFTADAPPAPSKPRGLTYDETYPAPSMAQLEDWGVRLIAAGVFQPHEIGPTKRVSAQGMLGRTTESIGHITEAWPEMHNPEYREAGGSAALLEAYIVMGRDADIGTGYKFYSGIHSANTHTRRLVHNMVDAVTGENLFSMTGIGCLFNLKSRKLVKTEPPEIALMTKASIAGFKTS